jgi:hypothetical protein
MRINYPLALLILMLSIIACSPKYVALYHTKSDLPNYENQFYLYENDTLAIKYSFWQNKGIMSFSVYNKLNVPIYIDWKKSNYISNVLKFDYWSDKEVMKGKTSGYSYRYDGPLLVPYLRLNGSNISSETFKPERVTFLPPKAIIYKSSYILTTDISTSPQGSVSSKEKRPNNPQKSFTIYKKTFNKTTSPLVFRNFLTYSTQENFSEEKYVNDEFFVNEITYINWQYFKIYRTEKGNEFYEYPYQKGIYFYLEPK